MATPFQVPTADDVRALVNGERGLRISLYVPVPERPSFDEIRKFPRTYAHAVEAAQERMRELGVGAQEVDEAGERLRSLAVDLEDLHPATKAIAAFHGPAGLHSFALNEGVVQSTRVGVTAHLRPLIASVRREQKYRVISLSTKDVELYEGDARSLRKLGPGDVPTSLEEALGSELTGESLHGYSGASGGAALVRHGDGAASDARSDDRDRFHRALASALERAWSGRNDPIVLVADRAHAGRFRKVADRLPGLLDEGVVGNPRSWSVGELHERAYGVVRRWLEQRDERAANDAASAVGQGRSVAALEPAAEAAVRGLVSRVFVDPRARVAKRVDPTSGELLEPLGDEDALDDICGWVLARGGTAIVCACAGLPSGHDLLAELRN